MSAAQVHFSWESPEEWERNNQELNKVLEETVGVGRWVETRSFPPIGFTLEPVDEATIQKIKAVRGLRVEVKNYDD